MLGKYLDSQFGFTMDGPPQKKRRFFREKENDDLLSVKNERSPTPNLNGVDAVPHTNGTTIKDEVPDDLDFDALKRLEDEEEYDEDIIHARNIDQLSQREADERESRKVLDDVPSIVEVPYAFDKETFESFVGEQMPDITTFERIREAAGDNLERGVNMWFDGSWKTFVPERPKPAATTSASSNGSRIKKSEKKREDSPPSFMTPLKRMPEYRYIGAFGTEGWLTRSGLNIVKSGEKVTIERQRILPPKQAPILVGKGRLTPVQVQPRGNSAAAKRIDVIVRIKNARGEEIGRLSRETANWASTLIDQKICQFDATCVYAPERTRTNDTIFLQMRVSILRSAFNDSKFKIPDNRKTGIFEEKESREEKDLRLKQVAIVKLFESINLLPSRTSETTTRHKRQGLLQAAEVAEQYEKDHVKKEKNVSTASGSSTPSTQPSEAEEDGKELEQDQLDALYKKAQNFDWDAPEAEPADTFAMDLRPYQKQALHWMIAKEKDEKALKDEKTMHPLWEEYQFPTKDCDDAELPTVEGIDSFYINPYSSEMSLEFPEQEQHCLGGILADEMGLGKTIEMMSLIHSHKSAVQVRLERGNGPAKPIPDVNALPRLHTVRGVVDAPCTTLVVAPMSLLAQWHSEAENASKEGTLRPMIYYGSDKAVNLQTLCSEDNAANAPNVIITSYGVVLSEYNAVAHRSGDRGGHGGLFSLNYFRVILDEAHHIKNRQSKTAKACYEIAAEHRWVLTGTPIVNRLEDLFSLVRFLRVEPWSNFSFWKTFITVPFESKDFMRALEVVQTVLSPLVLRRTKDMKMPDGTPLVPLPPKTVEIVDIELCEAERDVYDYIFLRAKRSFADNVAKGTVLKAYTSIFAQILRLRQSCCHPHLVRKSAVVADELEAEAAANAASGLEDDMDLQSLIARFSAETEENDDANRFGAHALQQIRDEEGHECPLCYEEPMIEQTVTGCWHSACKKCLQDYIAHQLDKGDTPRCFNCRAPISTRDIFEVVKSDIEVDPKTKKPKLTLQRLGSSNSAKIEKLMEQLKELRREKPGTKSVVFSQFTSFLSLISPALVRANIPFLRLDGTLSQKARTAVLEEFKQSKKGVVLLLSLRAGGVGLNLTMAKRVWMMDPWWSFAVEAQAIDRIHRMGQDEEVVVRRFIAKNSVEERMLKVQDRKKFIASSLGMMSDEEKKLQRIEDIKELLS